jgi:hypothetical protein
MASALGLAENGNQYGFFFEWLRQGLNQLDRKEAGAWPAWRGGDFRSHRKPAGPAFRPPRTNGESPQPPQKTKNCSFTFW